MAVTGIPVIPKAYMDMLGFLGLYLIADDIEDIGEFDRLHHWQVGAAMLAASLLPPPPILVGEEGE